MPSEIVMGMRTVRSFFFRRPKSKMTKHPSPATDPWFAGFIENDVRKTAIEESRDPFRANAKRLARQTNGNYSNEQIKQWAEAYNGVTKFYKKACYNFVEAVENADKEQKLIMFSKVRTKKPDSLMQKIQGHAIEEPPAGDADGLEMFLDAHHKLFPITDLGGVRLIHLTRMGGNHLIATITKAVKELGWSVHERIAYVRNPDDHSELKDGTYDLSRQPTTNPEAKREAKEKKLEPQWRVKRKASGYTSYHYILMCDKAAFRKELKKHIGTGLKPIRRSFLEQKATLFIEVQTRSLIEEGWSEIEHRRRYKGRTGKGRTGDLVDHGLNVLRNVANLFDDVASNFDEIDRAPRTITTADIGELFLSAAVVTILSPDLRWLAEHISELTDYVVDGHSVYQIFARQEAEDNAKTIQDELKDVRGIDVRNRVNFWTMEGRYLPKEGSDHCLFSEAKRDSGCELQATRRFISKDSGGRERTWEEIQDGGSLDEFVGALEAQVKSFLVQASNGQIERLIR